MFAGSAHNGSAVLSTSETLSDRVIMIITKSREERGPSRIVFAHTSSTEYMLGVMAMLRVRRQVSLRFGARAALVPA